MINRIEAEPEITKDKLIEATDELKWTHKNVEITDTKILNVLKEIKADFKKEPHEWVVSGEKNAITTVADASEEEEKKQKDGTEKKSDHFF